MIYVILQLMHASYLLLRKSVVCEDQISEAKCDHYFLLNLQFHGGSISKGSELQVEVAEFLWRDVQVMILGY